MSERGPRPNALASNAQRFACRIHLRLLAFSRFREHGPVSIAGLNASAFVH